MNISELAIALDRELEYPIDRSTVIEQIGDVSIDGPVQPSDDIASILARLDEETYRSADQLFLTILGTVSDRYIGRKYYDDRGTNPGPPLVIEGVQEQESF